MWYALQLLLVDSTAGWICLDDVGLLPGLRDLAVVYNSASISCSKVISDGIPFPGGSDYWKAALNAFGCKVL